MKFIASDKKERTESEVQAARETVADAHIELAHAIHQENAYADHVSEEKKRAILAASLVTAEEIRRGEHDSHFWAWQRINEVLTGDCVALLP